MLLTSFRSEHSMTWTEITQAAYHDALEILPPAAQRNHGFLQGEPFEYRTCRVKGTTCASYAAFVYKDGRHYGGQNMTVFEFAALDLSTVP